VSAAGRPITVGIHTGPQHLEYEQLRDFWLEADRLGYDWASVFDHFIPIMSDPLGPCLEGWTTLTALAAVTKNVRVGTLVLGVGYRHPAVLANMAATLDVITGGRLEFGIGAGWHEMEYNAYGIAYPPPAVRIGQMAEAIQVCKALWTEHRANFAGKYFTLTDALCEPKPVQKPHPPVWVGGGGEQLTLRAVARYADGWNGFFGPIEAIKHKLDVLQGHCDAVGRDSSEIRKSLAIGVVVRDDPARAEEAVAALAKARHMTPEQARVLLVAGTPEEVAERLVPYAEIGIDLFIIQGRAPFDYESLRLFAEQVKPRLQARVPIIGGKA
jgi:F420-dependent oxidoreductase-like protein